LQLRIIMRSWKEVDEREPLNLSRMKRKTTASICLISMVTRLRKWGISLFRFSNKTTSIFCKTLLSIILIIEVCILFSFNNFMQLLFGWKRLIWIYMIDLIHVKLRLCVFCWFLVLSRFGFWYFLYKKTWVLFFNFWVFL